MKFISDLEEWVYFFVLTGLLLWFAYLFGQIIADLAQTKVDPSVGLLTHVRMSC